MSYILSFLDPLTIINTVGLFGIAFVVFAESGLFFGFFLPGDSLLFTAGFLASQNYLNIYWLVPICFLAAILGDNFGYWFGRKVGPRIFSREDSLFFHKSHVEKAQKFYEEHGNKTIFFARFIPIVRTFAPIVAGVGSMKYRSFVTYNLFGAFIWGVGMVLAGYFLGKIVPNADKYVIWIVLAIITISILPVLYNIFKKIK